MSSYDNNRHRVDLNVPGRGARTVYVDGCATGREAVETAEAMYGYKATGPAHWARRTGGGSSTSGGGGSALGGLVLLALPVIILGSIFGGGEKNETPSYTPAYRSPVESIYTPQAPATPSWDNGPCVTANFEPC